MERARQQVERGAAEGQGRAGGASQVLVPVDAVLASGERREAQLLHRHAKGSPRHEERHCLVDEDEDNEQRREDNEGLAGEDSVDRGIAGKDRQVGDREDFEVPSPGHAADPEGGGAVFLHPQ